MQVKLLWANRYEIVMVAKGDECPVAEFLMEGEQSTKASREGLLTMLEHVSKNGFQGLPAAWTHLANKEHKVYEFIKGNLRLFYFKGEGQQIVVCTCGVMKSGQKADKKAVEETAAWKDQYFAAIADGSLEKVDDHEDE